MSELTKRLRDIPLNLRTVVPVHYSATFTKHEQAPTMNTLDAGIAAHEAADRIEALEECLRELLDDTQHSEHSCTDADCPVAKARALLEEK